MKSLECKMKNALATFTRSEGILHFAFYILLHFFLKAMSSTSCILST